VARCIPPNFSLFRFTAFSLSPLPVFPFSRFLAFLPSHTMSKTLRHLTVLLALLFSLGAAAIVLLSPGEQMTDAARRFIGLLNEDQKKVAVMGYDDDRRVKWHFIPMNDRKGLEVKLMDENQKRAAFSLLRSALSQVGYDKARTIMDLDALLKVMQKGPSPVRDPERYYVTIFGEPAATGMWGLSFEGHHLSLNFAVENNKVTSHSPAFFGGNPGKVTMDVGAGPVQGTWALEKEEILGFELISMLDDAQRKIAITDAKAPKEIRDAGTAQPPAAGPIGLPASKLNSDQMHKLWAIIHVYAHNMPGPIAETRLKEISEAGFDKVYFAWAGAEKPGVGHYYRIEGPTFLIEYVNTQPDAAGNVANHPHAVWRDMRGDFAIKR